LIVAAKESSADKQCHGVVVPMVTPFTPAGELDEGAVRRIIDHLISGGVAGVFVLGTTGEDASLSLDTRIRLAEITTEHVGGRATVYAGISHNCLESSVELAAALQPLGVDILVARLPTYYALNGPEQQAYFETLLQRCPGPVMLYNISSTTHMAIPLEVIESLSQDPKVVGIKDSDNNLPRLTELLARLGGRPGFSILVGVSSLSVATMRLGADGLVPSGGNLVPHLWQALYNSCLRGDWASAEGYQRKVDELGSLLRDGYSLAQSLGRLKVAMGTGSLCDATVLPPLATPSDPQQKEARRGFLEWQNSQQGS
jgi:4-hydroxy-tetrahydrodipicolinate synthase